LGCLNYFVLGLLACQAIMLAVSAATHAPVMDDIAHLAAGVSNWELDRFDLYKVNPPLVRMVAALPVLTAGVKTDYGSHAQGIGVRAEFAVMDDFTRANGPRVVWLVTLARWGLIPLALLGGYVCYRWARELYGDASGILALTLWCFCPNVLAYAQILTADAGAAALGVTASYLFWKWLREPAWDRALVAGIALGLAELTKTTWAVLFVLWPALWICWEANGWWTKKASGTREHAGDSELKDDEAGMGARMAQGGTTGRLTLPARHGSRRRAAQLATILALGLLCLNAGYDFEGSGTKLGDYFFVSRPLTGSRDGRWGGPFGNRFAKTWLASLPVPLPRNYVEGIDLQWHDIEIGKPSYLRGRWKDRGWWYWYLYALAVKVPLGTWGLLLLAVGARALTWRWYRTRTPGGLHHAERDDYGGLHHAERDNYGAARGNSNAAAKLRDELVLLAPALAMLVLVSSQTGFSRYVRYVLPALPFAFIWISSVLRGGVLGRRKLAVVAGAMLAWSVGSSLWYAPHWMSYFNELAGGPRGGPAHLIDAQVDWGQDLLYLKKWLAAHSEAAPLGLVYFGPINPAVAGVDFVLPPKGILASDDRMEMAGLPDTLQPGWYAVSVNYLYGYPHFIYDEQGGRELVNRPYFSYFRRFEPAVTAGYSIYIYHLTAHDIYAAAGDRAR
jgi:hypothetical protein